MRSGLVSCMFYFRLIVFFLIGSVVAKRIKSDSQLFYGCFLGVVFEVRAPGAFDLAFSGPLLALACATNRRRYRPAIEHRYQSLRVQIRAGGTTRRLIERPARVFAVFVLFVTVCYRIYLPSPTLMILLFGVSKWVAGEETGGTPVCRDRRLAGQAGEDACPPVVWLVTMAGR